MSYARQLEGLFADAVGRCVGEGWQGHLQVYRDGYPIRLKAAIRGDYPATLHYLDAVQAERLLQNYIRQTPSTDWDLNHYSIKFATFLAQQPHIPALIAQCAAIESAISHCFWQSDVALLSAADLGGLEEEALNAMRFTPVPYHQILTLSSQAETLLTAFREGAPVITLPQKAESQTLLILRSGYEVQRHWLEPLEAEFLESLMGGMALGEAVNAISNPPALASKLGEYLGKWLALGVFQRLSSP